MQHRPSRRVSVPALIVFCLLALALVVLVAVRAVSVNNAESAETLAPAASETPVPPTSGPELTPEPSAAPTAEPTATPEPTPEPTAVPTYDGLSVQPTTYYNEGEQPGYTVTPDNNLNMRAGPSTDYDVLGKVPAATAVTALGTNEDGSWVVVNYNGIYGWLKTEYLNS